MPRRSFRPPQSPKLFITIVVTSVFFLLLLGMTLFLYFSKPLPFEDINDPQRIKPDAKVTIRVFSDFTSFDSLKVFTTLTKYQDKSLSIIYKILPIVDNEKSQLASKAVYCAYKQDNFWEYVDVLFQTNHVITAYDWQARQLYGVFDQLAKKTGTMDIDTFSKCYDDIATQKAIDADKQEAKELHVEQSPTIFWDNQQLSSIEELEQRLQRL
jgi:protein-disulfide isomerase